jgi:hypothetical protein
MNENIVKFINYCLAFAFTTILLVYIIKVPFILTNNSPLVTEYYIDNYIANLLLDFFLIGFYILIGLLFIKVFKIEKPSMKLFMIIIATIMISGGFMLYFLNTKKTSSFFSRWFHSVTYRAVIYDIILVGLTYLVYKYMNLLII